MNRFRRRFLVSLAATFASGKAALAQRRPKAPIAVLSILSTADDGTLVASTTGTTARQGARIDRYILEWGDGIVAIGNGLPPSTISHKFPFDGEYVIRLGVWDTREQHSEAAVPASIRIRNSNADAGTCHLTASALTPTAVQAMVDALLDGQCGCLPAGTATWSDAVVIPKTKGITVRGAGIGITVINISTSWIDTPRNAFTLSVEPGHSPSRITGMTIDHGLLTPISGCGTFCSPIAVSGHGVDRFRIDHVRMQQLGSAGVVVLATDAANGFQNGAELSGVIDQNVFRCNQNANGSCHPVAFVSSPAWDDTPGVGMAGNVSAGWGRPFSREYAPGLGIGSNKSVYIESNTYELNGFYQDGALDTFGGAQVVFRFNDVQGSAPGGHGFDSAAYRGPRWMEVYGNTLTLGTNGGNCGVDRGGGWIYFNNTCTHPTDTKDIAFQVFRARGSHTDGDDIFYATHGPCDGAAHTINVDGNVGTGTNVPDPYPGIGTGGNPGWPCLDQVGWHFDEDGGTSGFVSFPAYVFDNDNGSGGQIGVSNFETSYGNLQNYMKCNRDYYVHNANFATTGNPATAGNCSTGGVGVGPRASRPSNCAEGTAWWATDQGGHWNLTSANANDGCLDKCTATNTWTNCYYTPYTFPHPLRSSLND